jgi:hypothetical protein
MNHSFAGAWRVYFLSLIRQQQMLNACNVMWRATQGCRKLSSCYCSRPSVTLLHRPFFSTLIMWLNFPAASILWRETLHMNADMNTHVWVTWRWGRMRSDIVKFSPFKNWERHKDVHTMHPCFHSICTIRQLHTPIVIEIAFHLPLIHLI